VKLRVKTFDDLRSFDLYGGGFVKCKLCWKYVFKEKLDLHMEECPERRVTLKQLCLEFS